MTASRPAVPPSSAEVRSHQVAAPRTRLVVASAIAGLVLGALCGAVLGGLRPPVVTATAYVAVRPDPLVASGGTGQPSDAQVGSFLSTEVIYLSSPAFRDQLLQRVQGSDPEVEAARQQDSDTIELLVRDRTEEIAIATADAAVAVYAEGRTRQVIERLDAQLTTVTEQLAEAEAGLPPVSEDGAAPSVQQQAAEAQYLALLEVRNELLVARSAADSLVRPVQPAFAEPTGGLSPVVAGALGGGTLGVLLTVGTVVVARRFSRRVGGPEDLTRYGVPVLDPEVPYRRVRASALTPAAVEQVVATHAPRLAGQRDQRPGTVLVGPTSGVGTSYLALQHALYSARRSPTLLVRTTGTDDVLVASALGVDPLQADLAALPDGRLSTAALTPLVQESRVPGLWVLSADADDDAGLGALERALGNGLVEAGLDLDLQVVLDAPALDRSTAGLVAARRCGSAVLVVASGRTRRQEVERALDTFAGWGVSLSGLVTNRAPRASTGGRDPRGGGGRPAAAARRSDDPPQARAA